MSDPLYDKDLLRLAAAAAGAGTLDPCSAEAQAYNPACGDKISVTLRLDSEGRIAAMAHRTSACILTQASASILGAHLAGADRKGLEHLREIVAAMLQGGTPPLAPFGDYAALMGASKYRNRHACVLLPLDAVLNALKS